jgi:hypothetical protein
MQTLSQFGEDELAVRIRNEIYAVDVIPFPMADTFIAWSHSGMNDRRTSISFPLFHFYSVVAVVVLMAIARAVVPRRARKRSQRA